MNAVAPDLRAYLSELAGRTELSDLAAVVLWVLDQTFSLDAIRLAIRREPRWWTDPWVCQFPISIPLSNFDNAVLTQLLVRCSDEGIQLSIEPFSSRMLKLVFSRREPAAEMPDRPPSLEVAIAATRTRSYFGPVLQAEVPA